MSVIIPVYNTALYLENTVGSVLAQTFVDFELILVDDGSTDGGGELCDAMVKSDGRVRAIHQKNAGSSWARWAGVANANGELVSFVDSDDFILPGRFERFVAAQKESNADIVCGGMLRIPLSAKTPSPLPLRESEYLEQWQKGWQKKSYKTDRVYDTEGFMRLFFEEARIQSTCQFVMKKSVIRSHYFSEGMSRSEDPYFWLKLFEDRIPLKIRTLPEHSYIYIKRPGGVNSNREMIDSWFLVLNMQLRICGANSLDVGFKTAFDQLLGRFFQGELRKRGGNAYLCEETRKETLRLIWENRRHILRDPSASFMLKAGFLAMYCFPGLYVLARSALKGRGD